MKAVYTLCLLILFSCSANTETPQGSNTALPIVGTWQLLKGTVIDNGDTTVTDYTRNISFIKIINETHFAFLQHDLNKGNDSNAVFISGGGTYRLIDSLYAENLEYCSAREWEGNKFTFTVNIKNDTLTQYGLEKVESAGVNRLNIEEYVRVK